MMGTPVVLRLFFYSQAFFASALSFFVPLPHFHLSASLTPSFVSFCFAHYPILLTYFYLSFYSSTQFAYLNLIFIEKQNAIMTFQIFATQSQRFMVKVVYELLCDVDNTYAYDYYYYHHHYHHQQHSHHHII